MLRKGDTIKCNSGDEAVELMTTLEQEDIQTNFEYEHDGQKGIWLKVLKVGRKK